VTPQTPPSLGHDGLACREFLDALSTFARLHAVKMHRLSVPLAEEVPLLPCLDHEATLHEGVPPHAAAYIEDLGHRLAALSHRPNLPGQFAIADNIDPHRVLFLQHLIEVAPDLFFKRGFIDLVTGFSIDQHLQESCTARQTASMSGENTISATLHANFSPPSRACRNPARANINNKLSRGKQDYLSPNPFAILTPQRSAGMT